MVIAGINNIEPFLFFIHSKRKEENKQIQHFFSNEHHLKKNDNFFYVIGFNHNYNYINNNNIITPF